MHITIWESRYVSVDPTQSPSMPSQNTIKWNRKPGARSHNLNGVPVSGVRLAPKGTCWPANKTTIGVLRVKFMQSIGLSKVCCACLYENWQTWQFCSIYQSWIAIGCYVMQLLGLPPTSNHHQTSPSIVVPDIFLFIRCQFPVAQLPWHLARLGVSHGPCGRCRESDAQGVRQHGKTLEHAMGWCLRLYGDRYDRVCHGLLSNWQESSAELVMEWRRRVMIVQKCPEHVQYWHWHGAKPNCLQITP